MTSAPPWGSKPSPRHLNRRARKSPSWDDGFGDEEFIDKQLDQARVRSRTLMRLVGVSIPYKYDLGDCWEHTPLLEKVVLVYSQEQWLPWCLDGRSACPPEDVGGTGGYG